MCCTSMDRAMDVAIHRATSSYIGFICLSISYADCALSGETRMKALIVHTCDVAIVKLASETH